MAGFEDEAEFGSHFLDTMLEVEMTEEDGEVNISRSEEFFSDTTRILPPIPTFDLQNQTLTYKETYTNSLIQQGLSNPSLVTSNIVPNVLPVVTSAPIPQSPNSSLALHSKNLLSSMPSSVTLKANSSISKSIAKPNVKIIKNASVSKQMLASRFLRQVFKPEYIKNVFTKKDPPNNISEPGAEEMEFYKTIFKDVSNVQYCRIHCTICDKHLGCCINVEKKLMVHKMLKVLTCKPCSEFYGDGNFPCDTGDNCEIYCRWCGQGGALVCCSFCPRVFCKKCVKRNFGVSFLRLIQKATEWACFCCAQKPLWPHRAICRALIEYIELKKTEPKPSLTDATTCCDVSILKRKKITPSERNKILVTQRPIKINTGTKVAVSPVQLKNKIIIPLKSVSGKEQSILKTNVRVRTDNPNKDSPSVIKLLSKNSGTRSLSNTANVFESLNVINSEKSYFSLPPHQFIQSPVIHGETLITPPGSRKLVLPKTSQNLNAESSNVTVSLTNQTSNLDLNKIPTAKIPRDVQDLILKITLPDKKVQFVRLTSDGSACKSDKDFSIRHFNRSCDSNFVEKNLEDSFEWLKMMCNKLKTIKDKINARTKITEEKIFISSVKKIHFAYEKSMELLRELDETLLKKFEEWRTNLKIVPDVFNIPYEESKYDIAQVGKKSRKIPSKFSEKCAKVFLSNDSDVEKLDAAESSVKVNKIKCNNASKVFKSKSLSDYSLCHRGGNLKTSEGTLSSNNVKPTLRIMKNGSLNRKKVVIKKRGKKIKVEECETKKVLSSDETLGNSSRKPLAGDITPSDNKQVDSTQEILIV